MSSYHIQRAEYTERNATNLLEGTLEVKLTVESEFLHVSGSKIYRPPNLDLEKVLQYAEEFIRSGKINPTVSAGQEVIRFLRSGGKLIIPGSTMKGLVRSRLELSLPSSCYIVDRESNNESPRYKDIFRPVRKQRDRFDPVKFPTICPVCDLLGNMGLRSKVSFSDLVMEKGEVGVVNMRGIDHEVVKKGSEFVGKVVYYALKPYELGMLYYGLGQRVVGNTVQSKVMLMGKFKFSDRRFGRIKLSVKPLDVKALSDFVSKFKPKDFKEDW